MFTFNKHPKLYINILFVNPNLRKYVSYKIKLRLMSNKILELDRLKEKVQYAKNNKTYYNLDTNRYNAESPTIDKKYQFINKEYRLISNNDSVFNTQLKQLQKDDSLINGAISLVNSIASAIFGNSINKSNTTNKSSKSSTVPKTNKSSTSSSSSSSSISSTSSISTSSTKSTTKSTTSTKSKTETKSKSIPTEIRYQVWRKWNYDQMNGICFCCECPIEIEKFHCAHITARHNEGSIDPNNLRPTCIECNLKMGCMNLYEYILIYNLPGRRNVDKKDPTNQIFIQSANLTIDALKKLQQLLDNNKITKTEYNQYKTTILSKRLSLDIRLGKIKEIHNLC